MASGFQSQAKRFRAALERAQPERIVLHAGRIKTGSTFLQSALMEERSRLLQAGWLFPYSLMHRGAFQMADREVRLNGHAILSRFAIGRSVDARQLDDFVAEIADKPFHTLLFSAEDLGRDPRENRLAALGELFDGFDVRIVMYLRRPSDWINSFYIERLSSGHGREYKSYAALAEDLGAAAQAVPFVVQCQTWRRPPVLSFHNYDLARRSEGGLLSDFTRLLGLPALSAPAKRDVNRTPSFAVARGIRVFNALTRGLSGDQYKAIYDPLLERLASIDGEGRGSFLNLMECERVDRAWSADNRDLATQGFMKEEDYLALTDLGSEKGQVMPDSAVEARVYSEVFAHLIENNINGFQTQPTFSGAWRHLARLSVTGMRRRARRLCRARK